MTLSSRSFVVLGLALGLSGIHTDAEAQGRRSKLDRALREARRQGAVHRVIIRTEPGHRVPLKRALEAHGDHVAAEYVALSALSATVHGDDLAALDADPAVLSISLDADVRALAAAATNGQSGAGDGETTAVLRHSLGLDTVPFDGGGVNVAVIDSGIAPVRDLEAQIAGFWDFTRGGVATRPNDRYGHGTHVAGLIASSGVQSRGEFAGVAPGVRLYGFKVLDDRGRGVTSHVLSALEFIVASRQSNAPGAFRIDVINLSLGHPIFEPSGTDPLVRAVENAVRAGIVVVTAAGNIGIGPDGTTGYAGITSPGNAPSAITVAASDNRATPVVSDDRVAPFSSRGPTWFDATAKPDLVAPGVDLVSDAPRTSSLFESAEQVPPASGSGSFAKMSGTSMAAAVASGISALVLEASRSANPGASPLSPSALKAVLQYTASSLSDADGRAFDALTQGTGEINARGSVAMAQAIETGVSLRSPWLGFAVEPSTVIGGVRVDWSRVLLWQDDLVRGTDALQLNAPQWADDIVWGTTLGGDDVVWGTGAEVDGVVWGTGSEWAGDLVWGDRLVGMKVGADDIVWGTVAGLTDDNIVWGTVSGEDIVWGTRDGDDIVWGTSRGDDIVWGTADDIVWGTSEEIVWGTRRR